MFRCRQGSLNDVIFIAAAAACADTVVNDQHSSFLEVIPGVIAPLITTDRSIIFRAFPLSILVQVHSSITTDDVALRRLLIVARVFVQVPARLAVSLITTAAVFHSSSSCPVSWPNKSRFSCGHSGQYLFDLSRFSPSGITCRFQGTCNPHTSGLFNGTM